MWELDVCYMCEIYVAKLKTVQNVIMLILRLAELIDFVASEPTT